MATRRKVKETHISKIEISFTDIQFNKLDRYKETTGLSIAAIVRLAVNKFFEGGG